MVFSFCRQGKGKGLTTGKILIIHLERKFSNWNFFWNSESLQVILNLQINFRENHLWYTFFIFNMLIWFKKLFGKSSVKFFNEPCITIWDQNRNIFFRLIQSHIITVCIMFVWPFVRSVSSFIRKKAVSGLIDEHYSRPVFIISSPGVHEQTLIFVFYVLRKIMSLWLPLQTSDPLLQE